MTDAWREELPMVILQFNSICFQLFNYCILLIQIRNLKSVCI